MVLYKSLLQYVKFVEIFPSPLTVYMFQQDMIVKTLAYLPDLEDLITNPLTPTRASVYALLMLFGQCIQTKDMMRS